MSRLSQALEKLWRRVRCRLLPRGTGPAGNGAAALPPQPPVKIDPKLAILDGGWGHGQSLRLRRAVDQNGDYLPWYTYPAIEYLRQLDLSDARLFEWGAGHSSLFWSGRCREVVSIERSEEWCREISAAAPPNLTVLHIDEDPRYGRAILDHGLFDVVVIDGSQRFSCVESAYRCLRDGGLIVLDNSDWYTVAAARLRALGLVQIDFCGFGPVNNYTWATSIYLQGRLNFSTLVPRQPVRPVGSRDIDAEEEAGLEA